MGRKPRVGKTPALSKKMTNYEPPNDIVDLVQKIRIKLNKRAGYFTTPKIEDTRQTLEAYFRLQRTIDLIEHPEIIDDVDYSGEETIQTT